MQVIQKITIQNFRCFSINQFYFNKISHICGENGTGKTAILEAIALINGQNSFRSKALDNLIRGNVGQFEVMCTTADHDICITYDGSQKNLLLDNEKVSANRLKKMFCPVVFSPQHDLSLNSNTTARSFIDKLTSHLFHEHEKLLNKCKELLSERLKILLISGNKAWLHSIEEQIAQTLTIIFYNRLIFTQKTNRFFQEISTHTINIINKYTKMLEEKQTFSTIERQIVEDLFQAQSLDKSSNRNSITPNNVEYDILFNGQKIELCSSGQQKIIGSILALSTAFYAKKQCNGVIVLLDDINAKIDKKNQGYLHEVINFANCQTIISTIDAPKSNAHCIKLQTLNQ